MEIPGKMEGRNNENENVSNSSDSDLLVCSSAQFPQSRRKRVVSRAARAVATARQ